MAFKYHSTQVKWYLVYLVYIEKYDRNYYEEIIQGFFFLSKEMAVKRKINFVFENISVNTFFIKLSNYRLSLKYT